MSLFEMPERQDDDIKSIISKSKEYAETKPKIKLKGTSLIAKLQAITQKVKSTLGNDEYISITNKEEYINYCKQCVKDGYVAIDTETTGLDTMVAKLVGLCLYSPTQTGVYVPVGHISVITEQPVAGQLSIDDIKEGLEIIKEAKCIFHNGYYDIMIIYQNCGIMLEAYWDTLIAGHLLNENESHSLKDLYIKYILENNDDPHYFGELFEGIPFCYIPYDVGKYYAAKDAKMTYELFKFQKEYLTPGTNECSEYKLERVANYYYNETMPMLAVLIQMKLWGMEFDFEEAKALKIKYNRLKEESLVKFNESLKPFEEQIFEYNKKHRDKPLEYPLNYNSPDQMKVLFYDIAKIGVVYRKEPTGTGKNVLKAILAEQRFMDTPIRKVVEHLSDVKMYDKAIGGFIDKLTEDAKIHNGYIYSNLSLTSTVTGRLASNSPKDWAYME